MSDLEKHYLRDLRVWLPDVETNGAVMPACKTCGRADRVVPHSFKTDFPGRRVIGFNTCYYLMSRQYKCLLCEGSRSIRTIAAGERRNAENVVIGDEFTPLDQYTHVGYDDECMKRFPHYLRESFPAILTHKSGIDKTVAACLRPLADKGVGFSG